MAKFLERPQIYHKQFQHPSFVWSLTGVRERVTSILNHPFARNLDGKNLIFVREHKVLHCCLTIDTLIDIIALSKWTGFSKNFCSDEKGTIRIDNIKKVVEKAWATVTNINSATRRRSERASKKNFEKFTYFSDRKKLRILTWGS